jgi:hypothetical protein
MYESAFQHTHDSREHTSQDRKTIKTNIPYGGLRNKDTLVQTENLACVHFPNEGLNAVLIPSYSMDLRR